MVIRKKMIVAICLALLTVFSFQLIAPVTMNSDAFAEEKIQIEEKAKVKLNKTKATLYTGQTLELKVEGMTKKVKWSSSNKKIASVTNKGIVTAKKVGTATIFAKVDNKTYKCKITVKSSIKVKKTKVVMDEDEWEYVAVTYYGTGRPDAKSSDEDIVECYMDDSSSDRPANEYSLALYGANPGKVTITITGTTPYEKETISVTVKAAPEPDPTEPPAPEEPLALANGDIYDIFGRTVSDVNYYLENKLIDIGDGYYSNGFFGVTLDTDSKINWIALLDGTKYTLFGVRIGMGITQASVTLSGFGDFGWKPVSNLVYETNFTNTRFPERRARFVLDSYKKIKNVVYGILN